MSDQEPIGWGSDLTAKTYAEYATTFPMYRETSGDLVDIADVREGMKVVDLACGTGVTTQEILRKVGHTGHVFAVDLSPAMLDEARKLIKVGDATFLLSTAAEMHSVVPGKVDMVLSNSAMWQLNVGKTFEAVGKVLKPHGSFAFNYPGQFFHFRRRISPTGTAITLPALMQDIAMEKYNVGENEFHSTVLPTEESITQLAASNGFEPVVTKIITYQRTAEDVYTFEKIPYMTEHLLPGLPYVKRMEILDEAYKLLDKGLTYPNSWIYFVFRN